MNIKNFAVVVCSLIFSVSSHAALITGFTGDYDASAWSINDSNGGSADLSQLPSALILIEPDNGGKNSEITFFTTALTDLVVTFDWLYDTSFDACCSLFNFHGSSDGVQNIAAGNDFFGGTGTGTLTYAISAGSVFGWGNLSTDSCCGANIVTVSNVSFDSTSVPEPSTLAIMVLGAFGFVSRRAK
jgi:hypothetical protein